MTIRTETYRDLEEDISTVFNCDEVKIYNKIAEFHRKCIDGLNSKWDMFNDLIEKFVIENADYGKVDEVYIYHLTRQVSKPTVLLPLKELLLSENDFSAFLLKNGIQFKESDGHLDFFYKKSLIEPQQILDVKHQGLLARRLGYLGEPDFCVNGFSFWPDIEVTSNGYYRDLQFGPEIIGCLGRYLGMNLVQMYRENSKYYGAVFKVPIEKLIFDDISGAKTKEEKVKYLLCYSLQTLHGCYYNMKSSSNNPILRIDDALKVKVDHCILIKE